MKKITIIWTITLVLIVAGLTAIGFQFKAKNIDNIMEDAMKTAVTKYLGTYPSRYPAKGDSTIFKEEELINEGFDPKMDADCDGYVVVKNGDMGFTYTPYVKCSGYTTKGYDENAT